MDYPHQALVNARTPYSPFGGLPLPLVSICFSIRRYDVVTLIRTKPWLSRLHVAKDLWRTPGELPGERMSYTLIDGI